MNIVAISGSPRVNGNTNYLLDVALDEATAQGAVTEKIVLGQYKVSPCLGHSNCADLPECTIRDDAPMILDKVVNADGVILASPVYYYNVTAQMKAFIDRNYFLYKHGDVKSKAKALGLMVVAEMEGIEDTLRTLQLFSNWSFAVPRDKRVVVTGYASKPGESRLDHQLIQSAWEMGHRLVENIKKESG